MSIRMFPGLFISVVQDGRCCFSPFWRDFWGGTSEKEDNATDNNDKQEELDGVSVCQFGFVTIL